eukprot:5520512-Prymnesium_polylepis.1
MRTSIPAAPAPSGGDCGAASEQRAWRQTHGPVPADAQTWNMLAGVRTHHERVESPDAAHAAHAAHASAQQTSGLAQSRTSRSLSPQRIIYRRRECTLAAVGVPKAQGSQLGFRRGSTHRDGAIRWCHVRLPHVEHGRPTSKLP